MLSTITRNKEAIIETVFEKSHYCFVAVDENGVVTFLNDSYCRFLEVDREKAIGKHVTEIIENTRMHIVVETGEEEIADLQYIRGNHMIANRIPVFSGGKVVGAVGTVLYRDTKEWMQMNTHIKNLLLELENYRKQLRNQTGANYSLHDIVGSSIRLNEVKEKIIKASSGDVSILLTGESGTGKELFAHSIHQLSERHNQPFVKVNCAAIPEHLLESELFGYEAGAFTGAKKEGKMGKFEMADGGTLFLDEIADMPLNAQVKILRVLQEREIERIGSEKTRKVDVRIVAATNQSLEKLIEQDDFRQDLYYRINVVQIAIPPLRERPEDIRVLAKYYLRNISNRTGNRVTDFEQEVLDFFLHYDWPGNVRELENVVESAVHLSSSEVITVDDLPDHMQVETYYNYQTNDLKDILEKAEITAIRNALRQTDGDKLKAAKLLGIGKSSFYDKLNKYGL
ncbi:PAS domain S-box-containing protein [Lentibacillus persicus]|uniref:PAS domain S-box-containing protein n=1 Tax=Lentibacillus persicus TaxID=640948 RepID=A0A1I1X989_9BACI|nr:sigma 54-interacting transcriptional regulator [Lentibacillus persicus]SFE03986.1 PAS domain S-box-containing protein [Lentibacillus persicus]